MMVEFGVVKFRSSAASLICCMGLKVHDEFAASCCMYEIFCRCWGDLFQSSCLTFEASSKNVKVIP